jgi:hypothetical protein
MLHQRGPHAEIRAIQELAAAYLHESLESGASAPGLALTIHRCSINEYEREGPLPDETGDVEGEQIDVPV